MNSLNAGPNNVADILNNFIKMKKIILKTLGTEKKPPTFRDYFYFSATKNNRSRDKNNKKLRKLILSKIDKILMDLIIPIVYLLFYVIENTLKSILFSFLTLNRTDKCC